MNQNTLVLLPGLDGTGIMFRPLLRELEREVDPVVVSYSQEEGFTYEKLADKVAEALPRKEFFILGESFSGPIAVMLAARKPEGLRGIILCASFISNPSALFPSYLSFLVRAPLFSLWPVSMKVALLTGGRPEGHIRKLMGETRGISRNRALAARTRETLKGDVAAELKRCECPVMYMRGARDLVVRGRNLRAIQAVRKDVSDVTLDTSHLVLQEAPHESARKIREFMKSSLPRNSP